MKFAILVLLPLLVILSASQLKAEEIDLSAVHRCDELYCPSGSGGTAATESLQREVGIVVQRSAAEPVSVPRVVISTVAPSRPSTRDPNSYSSSPDQMDPAGGSGGSGGSSGSTNTGGTTADGESAAGPGGVQTASVGSPYGGGGSMGGASSGYGGMNIPQGAGGTNNPNVKHGLLYSDDEASKPDKQAKNTGAAYTGHDPSKLNPVELNRQNGAKGASKNDGASGGGGLNAASTSGGGGGFGQFEASAGAPTASKVGPIQNALNKLAAGLGLNNFFGSSGAGLSGGKAKGRGIASTGRGGRGGSHIGSDGKLKDPRAILQAQFDRYNRGIANSLEFGDSGVFLFKGMCRHYQNYARKNRIPNDNSSCPEQ